ncbi:hydroxyproline dehydrogenase-like isoform X2 [Corticium candelabrum]|uniref:hydroxyproline dehydrogenase-like isoform X2 n=1 Tax=Corticium candelabrum TaxID=121492 RepID=UPI002E271B40|nr:hydroxyproline dehydrogenase-like isoform X2 [Corticium candelabrum]
MKKTFYGQFIAGANSEEVIMLARRLAPSGIRFMPSPSVEDELEESDSGGNKQNSFEKLLDFNAEQVMHSIDLAEKLRLECEDYQETAKLAFKLTAIFKPTLLKLLSSELMSGGSFPASSPSTLHEHMQETANKGGCLEEYNNGIKRFTYLTERLHSGNLSAFIDAEYSYMQPAIRSLVLYMQSLHNRQRPVILNTQQTYLKSAEEDNKVNLAIADKCGFVYGAKIVRGAYMDKERTLAKKHGYHDPIYSTYEDTSSCYDRTFDVLLKRAAADGVIVMAATHNEDSVKFGVKRMRELGIRRQSGQALFSQQQGMCDHVTFALGQNGYLVYKYSPYGDLGGTMRYLNRRAQENRTALKGLRREKQLLYKEWKRRRTQTRS